MLFVSVSKPDAWQQVPEQVDGIELRLDLFPQIDLEQIKRYITNSKKPILLTLRKKSQGGSFKGHEEERKAWIEKLLQLEPNYFDLEYDTCPKFLERVCQKYQKTRFLLSYHNFQETPKDLDQIYREMSKYQVDGYKMAAFSHSANDALRMLLFARQHERLSVICMGEKGEFTRVLGPVVGNKINYACINREEQTAPGQLTVQELSQLYGFSRLNPDTRLYGLIGDPVSKSLGHIYHNQAFARKKWNGVYVKMQVTAEELPIFFPLAKQMGFQGLSITMPLKEKAIPFLERIDPDSEKIGAVNTLVFKEGNILGSNTDGIGALNAIEKKGLVKGKKVVLLGAGGAARAIAFEAIKRGANVRVLNRTVAKAIDLAHELGCEGGSLMDVPKEYDVLINCSPDPMPIDPQNILPTALVMDVVYVPKETPFLTKALSLGCQVVYGDEMFYNQASAQNERWTNA